MLIKCYNCEAVFDEDELEYTNNLYGEFYKRERVCPYCHDNDFDICEEDD